MNEYPNSWSDDWLGEGAKSERRTEFFLLDSREEVVMAKLLGMQVIDGESVGQALEEAFT